MQAASEWRTPYCRPVPDAEFADPRLAAIYDEFDDDRSDLDAYVGLVDEHGARSILDVGCGAGTLAVRLAGLGLRVTGIDPAEASLDIARRKPYAEGVRWIHGTTAHLPALQVDMAVMTGNVAQVFLGDDEWIDTLSRIRATVVPGGLFVFETRIPGRRAWEEWTPERTRRTVDIVGMGVVERSVNVLDVSLPLVSFRWNYRFAADGLELTSDSTLRFRELDELHDSLGIAGFRTREVRDAPDRPGHEHVVVAEAGTG